MSVATRRGRLRAACVVLAALACALAGAGSAAAGVGANDDTGKYAPGRGRRRSTPTWRRSACARSVDHRALAAERPARPRGAAAARPHGRRGPLGGPRRRLRGVSRIRRARSRRASPVRRRSARGSPSSPARTPRCGSSSSATSRTSRRFWRPQFSRSRQLLRERRSARSSRRATTRSKEVDPTLTVVGRRALAARERPAAGAEQRLDVAGALPRRARRAGTGRAGATAR